MAALLPILLLVMALYFVILPQRRRAQAQRSIMTALTPGDRVVTAGGMYGTIVSIDGDTARVEVADGLVVEFLPAAIVRRVEPEPEPETGWIDAAPPDAAADAGHGDAGHGLVLDDGTPAVEDHKEEN